MTGETTPRAPRGMAGGEALVRFVDAAFARQSAVLDRAREEVRQVLGNGALLDAAAVFGNFQRMVRIADGTGIPLDEPVQAITADLRSQLGIDRFASSDNTPITPLWRRPAHWFMRRAVRHIIRKHSSKKPSASAGAERGASGELRS